MSVQTGSEIRSREHFLALLKAYFDYVRCFHGVHAFVCRNDISELAEAFHKIPEVLFEIEWNEEVSVLVWQELKSKLVSKRNLNWLLFTDARISSDLTYSYMDETAEDDSSARENKGAVSRTQTDL